MIAAGLWLDGLIVALLLLALAALFQRRPTVPVRGAVAIGAAGRRLAERLRSRWSRLMRQAGLDPGSRRGSYWGAKLALAGLLPLLLLEALAALGAVAGWPWLALSALAGFSLPDLWLLGVRRARRRRVAYGLPYLLDLIVAFLHSGLGLVEAFRRAGAEGFPSGHPLAREAALVGRELDAGQDPIVAFRDLARRTGVPELNAVAAALRVGLRLGAPIRETLETQAEALWIRRREDAMKRIHRAEALMVFGMMLTGFPVLVVLMLFPAVSILFEAFGW